MKVLARAQTLDAMGRDLVHMGAGEPDFATPKPIVEAGRRALADGNTRYTQVFGLPILREAVSHWYSKRYGLDVPVENIAITSGASGALQLAIAALVNPGDQVLVTDPGYPCNRQVVKLFDGEPVAVNVDASEHYAPTAEQFQSLWGEKTRAAMVASPSNPTGTTISASRLQALYDVVAKRNGWLIVDEIYHGLDYGNPLPSAAALGDRAIVLNSFSKFFGMTGWRLGWVVADPALLAEMERLAQNLFIAPSTPAQYAALAAFSDEVVQTAESRCDEFRRRRDVLVAGLRGLGFGLPVTPDGAFYLYADTSKFGDDSEALCWSLLEEAAVSTTPGIDFGDYKHNTALRFAYTTSMDRIELGLERLSCWLQR